MADTITISKIELEAMIQDAIREDREENPPAATQGAFDAEALGEAVQRGMEKNQRRKVTFGEYIRRPHSSTHPDPKFPNGPAFKRAVWVNGSPMLAHQSTDAEITLVNKLTHSGRYLDRLVEVIFEHDGSEEIVNIRWNHKTNDQMNEIAKISGGTFVTMLEKIVAVQVDERRENEIIEEEKKARRLSFGKGKATQSAYDKAGVDA